MFDLHTHSIFSDGELIPAELIRRAAARGYRALSITDHADLSNIDFIVPRIVKICGDAVGRYPLRVLPGIELTHIPPDQISDLAHEARRMGAKIIVVHGETIVEPVAPGTNLAAVLAPIDILAHPGLVDDEVLKIARRNSICLEVSARKGHSLTNGHVVKLARKYKVKLVLNTDAHSPDDLIDVETARRIAGGAGLDDAEIRDLFKNSENLVLQHTK